MNNAKIKKIKLIAFDLDNTLYDESLYFKYGINSISLKLKKELGLDPNKSEKKLWKILNENGKHYHHLFDDFLKEVNLEKNDYLPKLLKTFTDVNQKLILFSGVADLLKKLKEKYRIAIITNGRQEIQKNKINLLNIKQFFDFIIYSSELKEDKPSKFPFQYLLDQANIKSENMIYVGDNPLTDFKGAKQLGIFTIRIPNKEFDRTHFNEKNDADLKINKLNELIKILNMK